MSVLRQQLDIYSSVKFHHQHVTVTHPNDYWQGPLTGLLTPYRWSDPAQHLPALPQPAVMRVYEKPYSIPHTFVQSMLSKRPTNSAYREYRVWCPIFA